MAVKYDKDANYQALIDEAKANGDELAAAKYEQQRNAKIADMNASGTNTGNYQKTNNYDYSTMINNAIQSGADASYVQDLLDARNEKIGSDSTLNKYSNDSTNQVALSYIYNANNQKKYDPTQDPEYLAAMEMLRQAQQNQPTYNNPYSSQLTDLYNQIVNRDQFSYDVNEDMLYKQYANQYALGGRTAMEDTAGQTASLTGGYGSSYGSVASQQQYDRYIQELNNIIPTLAEQSYQKYLNQGNELYNQYNLLNQQATTDYNQYMDQYNQWLNNLNYAASNLDSSYDRGYNNWASGVNQSNADREYNLELDKWNYQKAQDAASSSKTGSNKTPAKEETPTQVNYNTVYNDLASLKAQGATRSEMNGVVQSALNSGAITSSEAQTLFKKFSIR